MKSSIVRGLALFGVTAVLVGVAAAPSGAVTTATPGSLVPTSGLFAVDCDAGPDGQIYNIDASNADATKVGTGSEVDSSDCAGGGAWDSATNTMYYVAYKHDASDLASVDLTTGVSTKVGELDDGGTPAPDLDAIAIGTDGAAYAISDSELYSLDLTSGALNEISSFAGADMYGFAADPVSNAYYVLNYRTGVYSTIDLSDGSLTTVGTLALTPSDGVEGLQIDTNGTFWVENDGVDADIWSFDPSDAAGAVESGVMTVGGTQTYTETLLLQPNYFIAPTITSAPPAASVTAGKAFRYTVTVTGSPVTFSITAGALPTGLVLDATTGVISGTPTTTGSFSYTVTATNVAGVATLAVTQVVDPPIHLPIVSG